MSLRTNILCGSVRNFPCSGEPSLKIYINSVSARRSLLATEFLHRLQFIKFGSLVGGKRSSSELNIKTRPKNTGLFYISKKL
jgi:hypothetical protein